MIRRSVPEIFGTALIDLLVGALTIIALLWVLNSRNSGATGTSDSERTSAFAAIEQYGTNHIVSIRLSQPGYWSCRLNKSGDSPTCLIEPKAKGMWSVPRAQTLSLEVTEKDGVPVDPPIKAVIRVIASSEGFRSGLHLQIEDLDDSPAFANVEIKPCCDAIEPHYLRVFSLSPSGDIDRLLFWHAHGFLKEVLACNYGRPVESGSCSQSLTPRVAPLWVKRFKERLKANAEIDIVTLPLTLGATPWTPPSITNAAITQCVEARKLVSYALNLKFEPDGDVIVTHPDSLDANLLDHLVESFRNH